jgi:hypothetical protein
MLATLYNVTGVVTSVVARLAVYDEKTMSTKNP